MSNIFHINSISSPEMSIGDINSPGVITASYLLITNTTESFAPLPFTLLQLTATDGTPSRMVLDSCNSNSSFGSSIRGRRIRGSYTFPQAVQTDDVLLQITSDAYDGQDFSSANTSIALKTTENWTTASHGSTIQFRTTKNGQISSSVALEIGQDSITRGNFSGSFTGSITGQISSASYAISASYAPTSIHVEKGIISGSVFTGDPKSFNIVYNNVFIDTNYIVSIIGDDVRMWSTSNRSSTGFTINTNSNIPLTGMVMWRVEGI